MWWPWLSLSHFTLLETSKCFKPKVALSSHNIFSCWLFFKLCNSRTFFAYLIDLCLIQPCIVACNVHYWLNPIQVSSTFSCAVKITVSQWAGSRRLNASVPFIRLVFLLVLDAVASCALQIPPILIRVSPEWLNSRSLRARVLSSNSKFIATSSAASVQNVHF